MTESARDRQGFLRYALIGNASFSTMTGLFVIVAHDWIANLLGVAGNDAGLVGLGIGLLVFAATILINARRLELRLVEAWAVVLMDLAWVAGSYVILLVVPLTIVGRWVVAAVADLVLVFAVLQSVGIYRIRSHTHSEQLSHGPSA
jgi:hypothetical protein